MTATGKQMMNSTRLSLSDLLGKPYTEAVCEAQAFLTGADKGALAAIADEQVEFTPEAYQRRLDELVDMVGQRVCAGLEGSAHGAGTEGFNQATHTALSPLAGLGFIRIGEDGRAYLTGKSEHYHVVLGHRFPGYKLVENAKHLGIPNATHNSTRGHITRLLEEELVRAANGLPAGQPVAELIASREPQVLNRVINLETGSLVVEAALKMMLARFFRLEDNLERPEYDGRTPVFLVMADHAGGIKANYHGTTFLTQVMRGMWPEFGAALEAGRGMVVRPVRINDLKDFERALREYEVPPYKVAGFFHEIVLMNYGAIKLDTDYLRSAHALCREHGVPTMVDEIQSCVWSPELFLFREYGLRPDFVSVGKGFPGGEYAAARILTTSELDNLHQFGAMVTNGQEEIASVAYLVTISFVRANRDFISNTGRHYEEGLAALARKYPDVVERIEGWRHMSSVFFHSVDKAVGFVKQLTDQCIDISAQTYKADCPPAALTKLPLVSTHKMVDFLLAKMDGALRRL